MTPADVTAAKLAGAQFGVSPGATDLLLDACEDADLPLLPGAATATEAMRLLERGYSMLKFFPAEAAGGASALKGIGAPIPQVKFCPTGGVNPKNARSYLDLPNVVCAGGSWVAPKDKVNSGDWAGIEALAKAAAQL
jgi:2-dehydro-3-deoxyphosphogluconate aldolase/(4S)-4-hydroxy-2-oxoglutarate aldolase